MRHNTNYNPDVLTCLANLSNDEVFTLPLVANQMLDLLPKEIWKDKTATFLDPVSKSGVFLREIAKRLIDGLAPQFPNLEDRLNHIFKNQLFGIAITELTALLSRRTVYCSKDANGAYSLFEGAQNVAGNIRFERTNHMWQNGKCKFCGASKASYDRDEGLESHAYKFIHTDNPQEIFNMKFDVIIGNPPYQLNDGGGMGTSATPLYHYFIEQAIKLNPRYLTMIVPSRWFSGGKGLDSFRKTMLKDKRMKTLVDFTDSRDCFPGVDIAGGVCYFLWKNKYFGKCTVINSLKGKANQSERYLDEFDTFIRDKMAVKIVKKVKTLSQISVESIVSPRNAFGLDSRVRAGEEGELHLISSGGEGKFKSTKVSSGHHLIDSWKVFVSKASYDHGGQPDNDGRRRILSKVFVAAPKTVCTETYLVVGAVANKKEATNLANYLRTKFTRFLIASILLTQNVTRNKFKFVPLLDFSIAWDDDLLYQYFGISESEIEFIEASIKDMAFSNE